MNSCTHSIGLAYRSEHSDQEFGRVLESPSYQRQMQHLSDRIKARDDFLASYLPSSRQHCLDWLKVAGLGTGAAVCGAGALALGGLYIKSLCDAISEQRTDAVLATSLGAGLGLIPSGGVAWLLFQGAQTVHQRIGKEDRELLKTLERDVADAMEKAADQIAIDAPDDVFQSVLDNGIIRPGALLSAMDAHHPRAAVVMQRIADQNLWSELDHLPSTKAKDVHIAMGDALLATMADPTAFVNQLTRAPDPEHLLAVACFAGQATVQDAGEAIETYLREHPDVVQKAAARVQLLCDRFEMGAYAKAIADGRVAGLPLEIRNLVRRIDLPH